MNEKPVLFNAEMVRAILEGRKTQTRRPMKVQPESVEYWLGGKESDKINGVMSLRNKNGRGKPAQFWECACPFPDPVETMYTGNYIDGKPELLYRREGRLWVRETFAYTGPEINIEPGYVYRATDPEWSECEGFKWTPSIHMPREASRINLKVKRAWVERIQDISSEDCKKEGINWLRTSRHKTIFKKLWESCGYEWDSNPFVWCCEFEVLPLCVSAPLRENKNKEFNNEFI